MDVHHSLNGSRRVEYERPDHTRIVAERGHGYVSHEYIYRGHEYAHRTYYMNGRAYDRFYNRYEYRPGIYLEVYAPVRYYPVGFYGWAYNPWVTPIRYTWGWNAAPWYGYYGAYWRPYPVYSSAYFWLTDYLISESLAAAYQAQVDAGVSMSAPLAGGNVMISASTQQLIADEVRRQIALENAEAQQNAQATAFDPQSSGVARMLGDNSSHVFVAGSDLDLLDSSGQECAISQGDVLQFNPSNPLTADGANLVVLASKGGLECRTGSMVQATFGDLQAMQNHMRETIDSGMTQLQSHQGGIPMPPPSAMGQVTQASFAMGAPPPDPTVQQEITQQFTEASLVEQDTLGPGAGLAAAGGGQATTTVSLGMTTDQVVGAMGQPKNIMDLGNKKIYVYQDLKITFQDGKVSDVN